MKENYWTVTEIAEKLRVHPQTVKRWLREGRLRGMSLGDRAGWRVANSDLERFIDDRYGDMEQGQDDFDDTVEDRRSVALEEARLRVRDEISGRADLSEDDIEELFNITADEIFDALVRHELMEGDDESKIAA